MAHYNVTSINLNTALYSIFSSFVHFQTRVSSREDGVGSSLGRSGNTSWFPETCGSSAASKLRCD